MIKAIIFDCFGVLYEDALKEFVEHHTQTPAQARHYYDLALGSDRGLVSDPDFYAQLARLSGQDPAVIRRRLNDTSVLNRALIPFIEGLRAQYKIGLLSNADRAFLDHFLAAHNVGHLFDATVASSETPYVKPQREIFELTSGKLGVTLTECIFIDDSPGNVEAARSYGMTGIHYQSPHLLKEALARLGIKSLQP